MTEGKALSNFWTTFVLTEIGYNSCKPPHQQKKKRQRLAANTQNISELTVPVYVYFLPLVFSTSLLNYLLMLILSLLMVIYNQY